MHPTGSLRGAANPGSYADGNKLGQVPLLNGYIKGTITLQELPNGAEPGSLWRQVSDWGVGSCDCFDGGTTSLTKILDGNGDPLEPYYSQFTASAGSSPFYLWTGWASEEDRQKAARRFAARAMSA